MNKNQIRLGVLEILTDFLPLTKKALLEGIEKTKNNTRMTLTLALNYSSRWEITEAMRKATLLASQGNLKPEEINETKVSSFTGHRSNA